jgi:hypothetical protein
MLGYELTLPGRVSVLKNKAMAASKVSLRCLRENTECLNSKTPWNRALNWLSQPYCIYKSHDISNAVATTMGTSDMGPGRRHKHRTTANPLKSNTQEFKTRAQEQKQREHCGGKNDTLFLG